jgi:hypothetical protein
MQAYYFVLRDFSFLFFGTEKFDVGVGLVFRRFAL